MTMIERVAQAIHDANREGINPARAAIEAMREPTEEMKGEGYHPNCHMCGGHLEGWQRMIDAALKETE